GGDPGIALPDHVHAVGAAAGFGRGRPAPRRARRDLRDRGAGRGRRRGFSPGRARQISAVRGERRQAGGAQLFRARERARRVDAAAHLEGHRRQDRPRPQGAARDPGRRRLRRSGDARGGARRARRAPRLCLARGRSPPLQGGAGGGGLARRRGHREGARADMSGRGAIVGVDVGGTFTDLFLLDPAAGRFRTAKVPSHRGDEAQGFLRGLKALGGVGTVDSIVHGTTAGTNALLERRGPKIGVITTCGFRDVLEMRRRDRRRTWGLWGDFVPIAERDMRVEVNERTLADGSIRTAVDPEETRAAAKRLLDRGAQSIAVIFINAYANA